MAPPQTHSKAMHTGTTSYSEARKSTGQISSCVVVTSHDLYASPTQQSATTRHYRSVPRVGCHGRRYCTGAQEWHQRTCQASLPRRPGLTF
jgi:hypothetical protein